MRSTHFEEPTPLDRGGISGDLKLFSPTNTALRAVKETKKCEELHGDLTQQCDKPLVTMSAVLHCIYLALRHPRRQIEVIFLGQSTRFSTTDTSLRAVQETEKCNESHGDLTRQYSKSPVTMSAVLYSVYLALRYPRLWIEVLFQVS